MEFLVELHVHQVADWVTEGECGVVALGSVGRYLPGSLGGLVSEDGLIDLFWCFCESERLAVSCHQTLIVAQELSLEFS